MDEAMTRRSPGGRADGRGVLHFYSDAREELRVEISAMMTGERVGVGGW